MPDRFRLILAKRFAADLESIFNFIAKDSPDNAAATVKGILDSIENLTLFPHRSVVEGQRPGLRHPVRSIPVHSYIVFFRVIDEHRVVRILRVRHAAQRRLKRFE